MQLGFSAGDYAGSKIHRNWTLALTPSAYINVNLAMKVIMGVPLMVIIWIIISIVGFFIFLPYGVGPSVLGWVFFMFPGLVYIANK